MHKALTIQEKLKDLRVECGLTLEQLAEQTDISSSALGSYENDEGKDISNYSIITLAKFYEVSADYLLGLTESKNHPNSGLNDLHLSDNMIDLLRSGQINNRLLCEMASHKDFVKLLADIEIYVDGIAAMQVQNLNAYVTLARRTIEKKYSPGESDHHIQILNAAHINEDDYFCSIVHAGIDGIIRDIKDAHCSDSESAPDIDFVQELNQDLAFISSVEGNKQKRQVALYCRRLGIDYKKLTDVEFEVLVQIMKKSKLMGSGMQKQGKKKRKK